MRIVFLDCTKTKYNGETLRQKALGGIETTTVALSEAFVLLGYNVSVINNSPENIGQTINGVQWFNHDTYDFENRSLWPNIVIVNNDANLFDSFPRRLLETKPQTFIWLHNPVSLFKTLKKKRMPALLKWHPTAVFLGEKQKKQCSILLPFQRKIVIPHALTHDFLNRKIQTANTREQQAIFFSQAYRGFDEIVNMWIKYIYPEKNKAVLKAYIGDVNLKKLKMKHDTDTLRSKNILIMPKVSKSELIRDLKKSRCMPYLGHKDETFCVAALEANALGIPIITYGRGALSERVENNINGFLVHEKNEKQYTDKVLSLLNNDKLFSEMSNACVKYVSKMTWNNVARKWIENAFTT